MQNKRIRYEVESQADGTADIVTDRILFVEVFAGSAKLSKAADNRGFRVLAVDHSQQQHRRYPPLIPEFASFVTMSPAPLLPHKLLEMRSKSGGRSGSEQTR